MFTKEINQEIVDVLVNIAPVYLEEHEKWKRLHLLLAEKFREVKRTSLRDFKEHIVKQMFDIKKNKFKIDAEHVRKICYPFLIELLQFKVVVRSSPDYTKIPNEKLARHRVLIKYMLSKHFIQELWDELHKIAEQHPDEYFVINIKNPQYGLSPKEQMTLNRLAYKEKSKGIKQDCLLRLQNKWLSKKVSTTQGIIDASETDCGDIVAKHRATNVQVGVNEWSTAELGLVENNAKCNQQQNGDLCKSSHTGIVSANSNKSVQTKKHVEFSSKASEEIIPNSGGREISPIYKSHGQVALTSQLLIETGSNDFSESRITAPTEDKGSEAIHELSSDGDEEFSIPFSFYDNLSSDSDSLTENEDCRNSHNAAREGPISVHNFVAGPYHIGNESLNDAEIFIIDHEEEVWCSE